jgi:hypothetical protein
MENLRPQPTGPRAEAQVTQKRPYELPKATFVPLKLEERLIGCTKTAAQRCGESHSTYQYS